MKQVKEMLDSELHFIMWL